MTGSFERIEVITGVAGRRRWSVEREAADGGVLSQRRSINERMVREGWELDYRKYSNSASFVSDDLFARVCATSSEAPAASQGRPEDAGGTIVGRSRAPVVEAATGLRACAAAYLAYKASARLIPRPLGRLSSTV